MEGVLPAAHASIGMPSSKRDVGDFYSAQSLVMEETGHPRHSMRLGTGLV